jgi:hypothetical protein
MPFKNIPIFSFSSDPAIPIQEGGYWHPGKNNELYSLYKEAHIV